MAGVFISYARDDRDIADRLAHALQASGLQVWWDREILPGKDFAQLISAELATATAVIVIWTPHSIESRWVRDEAYEGLKRGVLLPVLAGVSESPIGFRAIHAMDITSWDGEPSGIADIKVAIAGLSGQPADQEVLAMNGSPRIQWGSIISALALFLTLGSGLLSVYSSIQQSLHDLDHIQGTLLPGLLNQARENGSKLDNEINRSRDVDTTSAAKIALLEENMTRLENHIERLVRFADARSDDVLKLLKQYDPRLAEEYRQLRERDEVILPDLLPPVKRGKPGVP